jgi:hypothetical protein
MGWKATGEDRVKSFKVYQDLEQRYQEALRDKERLEAMVRTKDNAIRDLARELHQALEASTLPQEAPLQPAEDLPASVPPKALSEPYRPIVKRTASGTIASVGLPLKDRLAGQK